MQYSHIRLYQTCSPSRDGTFLKDYREESFHKPMFAAPASDTEKIPSFGNPHYEFENLTPRKGHEFDEMEVPVSLDLMDPKTNPLAPTFLIIRNGDEDNPAVWLAGWIDSVEPVATKGPSVNTRIHWHIDYWLTLNFLDYLVKRRVYPNTDTFLTFGPGRFKRGGESLKRPEPSEPRKWIKDSIFALTLQGWTDSMWVIVAYTKSETINQQVFTTLEVCYWLLGSSITHQDEDDPQTTITYSTPSVEDVFKGKLEERLGFDPDTIVGCWASPIPPYFSSPTSPIIIGTTSGLMTYAAYSLNQARTHTPFLMSLGETVHTDDDHKYVFYDITGTEMYTAPWGLDFNALKVQLDIGSSGTNLQIQLVDPDGRNNATEGALFTFPLPLLPITENAWSSYNYSGEREYDIRSREIQKQQALKSGVASSGNTAIGGLLGGAMVGGPVGAIVGATAGFAMGTIGSFLNQHIQSEADDKTQRAIDQLKSSQASALILTARGYHGFHPPGLDYGWNMVKFVRDPVSSAELAAEHQELGFITDCYAASCDTLIRQGGGMRIEGLEVQGWGSRDRQARDYISAVFARGVHIDII